MDVGPIEQAEDEIEIRGAARLEPHGARFANPIVIQIGLREPLPPGSEVTPTLLNPTTGVWEPEGIAGFPDMRGVVSDDGLTAFIVVDHFSDYGIARPTQMPYDPSRLRFVGPVEHVCLPSETMGIWEGQFHLATAEAAAGWFLPERIRNRCTTVGTEGGLLCSLRLGGGMRLDPFRAEIYRDVFRQLIVNSGLENADALVAATADMNTRIAATLGAATSGADTAWPFLENSTAFLRMARSSMGLPNRTRLDHVQTRLESLGRALTLSNALVECDRQLNAFIELEQLVMVSQERRIDELRLFLERTGLDRDPAILSGYRQAVDQWSQALQRHQNAQYAEMARMGQSGRCLLESYLVPEVGSWLTREVAERFAVRFGLRGLTAGAVRVLELPRRRGLHLRCERSCDPGHQHPMCPGDFALPLDARTRALGGGRHRVLGDHVFLVLRACTAEGDVDCRG
nr:hypothetical protein [Deltaproteobacteria bacterium]